MDPTTVIALGLQIGSHLVNLYSNPEEISNNKIEVDYEDFLEDTVNKLELIIENNNKVIIDKIESDRLESLQSAIVHYSSLVRGKADIRPHDRLYLRNEVDYAGNRLLENKQQWLTPYLIGESLFIVILKIQQEDNEAEKLISKIKGLLREQRIRLLELRRKDILKKGITEIPWLDIHHFIEGKSEVMLESLIANKYCAKCGCEVKHSFSFCMMCGESLN